MARNEEKAQSMLNRFLAGKQAEARGERARRPYLASECHNLNEADKWRQQILREIGKKVMEIQNAGLGEHRIRDLNDEINKLMREKRHWERRILALGGPDYARTAPRPTDADGRALPAEAAGRGPGYRYFGAAKSLPGVAELFDAAPARPARRAAAALRRAADGDYYGFRDEEDGVLERVEAEAEAAMRAAAAEEWRAAEAERAAACAADGGGGGGGAAAADAGPQFVAYVPLPEEKEIEARVLEAKKAALVARYASEALVAEQEAARELATAAARPR